MMRRFVLMALMCVLASSASAEEQEFLGVPLLPQAQIISKTDARLAYKCRLSHDDTLRFYKDRLAALPDIRYREWEDATYIEDDGRLPWHSITVSKGQPDETTVVIMKDNWTWIIGTLVLRFIGVFAVLLVLLLGMALSGGIISRSLRKIEAQKKSEKPN